MPVFLQASVRMHAGWFLSLVMLLYAAFSSLSNPYPKTSASEVPKPSSPQVPDPGHSGVFAEWHFLPHSKRDPVRANVAVFAVWCVWPLPSTCRGAARKESVTAFSQSLLRMSLVTSLALYVGLSADSLDSLDSRSYAHREQTGQLHHAVGVQPDLAETAWSPADRWRSSGSCLEKTGHVRVELLHVMLKPEGSRLKTDSSGGFKGANAKFISAVWALADAGIRRPGARGFGYGLVTQLP